MEDGSRRRHRPGLDAGGDGRARQLRRALPRRHRAGLHDGVHPDAQCGSALRRADRSHRDDVPGPGHAATLTPAAPGVGVLARRSPRRSPAMPAVSAVSATMQALVVLDPNRLEIQEVPVPTPGSNEVLALSLIHISEPTRLGMISYAVFCLKKK